MKKIFYIIVFLLIMVGGTAAQPGFMKWYDFGKSVYFHNIIEDNNSLIIVGHIWKEGESRQDAFFVRMDTTGNVLSMNTYADSLGSHLAFRTGWPLLKSKCGGYISSGVVFNRQADFILKWSMDGKVDSYLEIPNREGDRTSFLEEIVELDDGYILFFHKQIENYTAEPYVMRIDREGNILWERSYGDDEINETFNDLYIKDKNTYVIGCTASTTIKVKPEYRKTCTQQWVFAIDSMGEVKWEWRSEPCEGSGVENLKELSDGTWLYSTREVEVWEHNDIGLAPMLVKRDSAFNLIWERRLADSYSVYNRIYGLAQGPDRNWVGAGSIIMPEPYHPRGGYDNRAEYACLYKISESGDSIWRRCDTISLQYPTSSHEYAGVVVLESGSVIAAGSFDVNAPGIGYYGLLTKTDRNGCIADSCLVKVDIDEVPVLEKNEIKVFPNPTQGEITIYREESSREVMFMLMDVSGNKLREVKIPSGVHNMNFHIDNLKSGIYFYHLKGENASSDFGKIILID